MPIRPVTSQIRNLVVAAALLLVTASAASAQEGVATELTLDQARAIAARALQSGDPGLAFKFGRALLLADPKDAHAHYLIASALARMNKPRDARLAATRAYRYAPAGGDRFQAAQLAARLAFAENRPTLTQIWLRRTAIHAPSEAAMAAIAKDYQALRRINPWSLRLRTELRPSDNVNNGSDTALQIIDGVPVTGFLSGSAQALSGLIGTVDLALGYRLHGDASSATALGGRLFVQRVALSNSAKVQAPGLRNSDLGLTYGELSLRHGFSVGPPDRGGTAALGLALGESWAAGERAYRFGRISAERGWRLDAQTHLKLNALAERRSGAAFAANDARVLGFGAELGRKLANGDDLYLSLAVRDTDAQYFNGTFRSASVRTGYALGRPVGPVRLSAGLVLGYSDYPVFRSGIILVPGGRQDTSLYGDLNLLFDRIHYAGFAPVLRFRAGRKSSNDSRFSTREFSVSLGIESKF